MGWVGKVLNDVVSGGRSLEGCDGSGGRGLEGRVVSDSQIEGGLQGGNLVWEHGSDGGGH